MHGDHAGGVRATQNRHHVLTGGRDGKRSDERSGDHPTHPRPAPVRTGHAVLDGAQSTRAAAELDLCDRRGGQHSDRVEILLGSVSSDHQPAVKRRDGCISRRSWLRSLRLLGL